MTEIERIIDEKYHLYQVPGLMYANIPDLAKDIEQHILKAKEELEEENKYLAEKIMRERNESISLIKHRRIIAELKKGLNDLPQPN